MNEIYLIGLGNPGKKYSNSRHNIGFLLLENLSKKYNSNFLLKDKLKSFCSEFKTNDSTYRLFLPNTFMNNSGEAVQAIVDWYKISLDQIFVIVDDKDLPLGKIRFRKKGSSGGHNGLKSIIEKLQTHNFNRIRIGIGSPPSSKEGTNNFNTISHVLGNISLEEKSILDKVYLRVIESLEQLNTKKEEYIINKLNSFDKDQI
ncbi:Peptidyl-tRNA hydrolase [Prochlorococcus marinus str. MIT 9302]|uniref:Peptidyl-tRNA hydrolase n=1 Tax=Prochlorococcus marinus str. MIT 9302 TaxID=74545 RepID=A0A0A2A721_PROMR|nr:aminoacyl-tRNA hydrolase [Prochlorococcus marinus]KGF96213.1 Peptidyl-tRNA hydrolase [Prochlorococcus marinus str. MIT 9302]